MNYADIKFMDVANGPGLRISLFVQGCHFHCEDCFNSSTWDFEGGIPFTNEVLQTILNEAKTGYIKGLSILGGEPLNPKNIKTVTMLAKRYKEENPDQNIWLWTGYLYEDVKDKEIMNYVDVVVDGQFKTELKSFKLKYKGSSNQRVIDIKNNRIVG